MPPFIDLTGKQFGRWTVLYRNPNVKGTQWICKCSCGNIKSVRPGNLKHPGRSQSTSCGCYQKEAARKAQTKHGFSHTKIQYEWTSLKQRCNNPNNRGYKNYGGRGIKVCDEWSKSFKAFYDYVSALPHFGEEGRSLDRIDNEGDYEPGNVRWATRKEQNFNKRTNKGYWDKPHKKKKEKI